MSYIIDIDTELNLGDKVNIVDGPFKDMSGVVESIDKDNNRLNVLISSINKVFCSYKKNLYSSNKPPIYNHFLVLQTAIFWMSQTFDIFHKTFYTSQKKNSSGKGAKPTPLLPQEIDRIL